MVDIGIWALAPLPAPAATDRMAVEAAPGAGGHSERGDFIWKNGSTFEGSRATDGDVMKIGKAGGPTLYAYADGSTVALFNTAGAGAGRVGPRFGANFFAIDVDAAEAIQFNAGGHWLPGFDNSRNIGSGAKRIQNIYLVNSPTVTSDAEDKDWLQCGFSDAELQAARRIAAEIGSYRWLASIVDKGDAARIHIGVRAQAVWAIMADEGLIDPVVEGAAPRSRFAFLCYDEWEAVEAVDEVRDAGGDLVRAAQPAIEAGFRFGIRPDQLIMFLIAAQDARLAALEAAL